MKVLVGCEYSGIVRDAFSLKGWDAWSCDLLPTESELTKAEGKHLQCDVREVLGGNWDLLIAHPVCRYLTLRAQYWNRIYNREKEFMESIEFFMLFVNSKIKKKAIENPVGVMSTLYRRPDQIVQPYYFGDPESKKTCLWLFGLPPLIYEKTNTLFATKTEVEPNIRIAPNGHRITFSDCISGKDRDKRRSKTFPGIANAMAEQWTEYLINKQYENHL